MQNLLLSLYDDPGTECTKTVYSLDMDGNLIETVSNIPKSNIQALIDYLVTNLDPCKSSSMEVINCNIVDKVELRIPINQSVTWSDQAVPTVYEDDWKGPTYGILTLDTALKNLIIAEILT